MHTVTKLESGSEVRALVVCHKASLSSQSLRRAASQKVCSPCWSIQLRTRGAREPGRLQSAEGVAAPRVLVSRPVGVCKLSAYCLPAISELSILCSFPAKNKVLFALRAKALEPSWENPLRKQDAEWLQRQERQLLSSERREARSGK